MVKQTRLNIIRSLPVLLLLGSLPEAYRKLTVRRDTLHRALAVGRKSVMEERRVSQMRRASRSSVSMNRTRPASLREESDEE
jgi:hypothetical protein